MMEQLGQLRKDPRTSLQLCWPFLYPGWFIIFGVINVISKRGRNLMGAEISGSGGSFDTYKGRVSYGNQWESGLELLVCGTGFDSKGHRHLYYPAFDSPATNNGVAVNNNYEKNVNFFERITLRDFTLEGGYITREKGIPTASWGRLFNYSENRTIDTRSFLELRYEHALSGSTKLMARTYYDFFSFKADYVYDGTLFDKKYCDPAFPEHVPIDAIEQMG